MPTNNDTFDMGPTDSTAAKGSGKKMSYQDFLRRTYLMPKSLLDQFPEGKSADETFKAMQKMPWFQSIVDFTKLPAEGVVNALGAGQRANAAVIANFPKNPRGAAEAALATYQPLIGAPLAAADPAARKVLGEEKYAALHPNDMSAENRAEAAVHLEKLMAKDPDVWGKMRNFAVRTAFQTLTDPLTYTGAGTAHLATKLLDAYDVVSRLALLSKSSPIRTAARELTTNVPEKLEQAKHAVQSVGEAPGKFASRGEKLKYAIAKTKAVAQRLPGDKETISAINTARNKGMDVTRRLQSSDAELLSKYRPWFKKATIGDWLKKNAEFMQKRGAGKIQGIWPKEIEDRLAQGRTGQEMTLFPLPEPPPGVDRAVWEHTDAESILRDMFDDSREQIRRNTVQDALHQNTKNLTQKQIEAIANVQPEKGGATLAHKISRAQVDAMLTTGLPHMRNVGVAGYMALGEAGVAKAMFYATRGVPAALKKRLEEGGTQHFGLSEAGEIMGAIEKVPGVRQFRKVSTGALDKWDEALRAVRLEQLDKEMPMAKDFEKLDRVNQDLGAYNIRPKWVERAPAWGANFPQWHGYVVPTMLARGLLRNPGRIGRFGRYETNFNDTFFPNERYRWTFGGPIDEGFSAAADPARIATGQYPSYFGGPSTAGLVGAVLRPSYQPLAERAIEFGAGALPFGNSLTEGYFRQFPEIPGVANTGAGLAGFYTQKRTPGSLRRGATMEQPHAAATTASKNTDTFDMGP